MAHSSAATELDLNALTELQELLEDDFAELIRSYLDDAKKSIPDIEAACAQPDFERLRRSAHSQKGSALNMGAPGLAAAWAVVEEQAKAMPSDSSALMAAIATAKERFTGVHQQLLVLLDSVDSIPQ